jgi:peptidoglycan/LPS O-acetylase OafA/YrhL
VKEAIMDPETLRYWLNLAIGAPMALIWFVIVLFLSIYAAKGNSPRLLRRVAISTAVASGLLTASYLLLIAWNPVWYADWIGSLYFLLIMVCYGVALTCMIWSRNPPRTPAEARLTLYESACIILFVTGFLIVSQTTTEPYSTILLIPFGILTACVCVVLQKAKRRLNDSHSP